MVMVDLAILQLLLRKSNFSTNNKNERTIANGPEIENINIVSKQIQCNFLSFLPV